VKAVGVTTDGVFEAKIALHPPNDRTKTEML
jgi:hypothetical protein